MLEPQPSKKYITSAKLLKLLKDPQANVLVDKINARYLYWDKAKYLPTNGLDNVEIWYAAKLQRSLRARTLTFGKYKFTLSLTDEMHAMLNQFDVLLREESMLANMVSESEAVYYRLGSSMEEAIASSQMEGATTTRRVAKEMLSKQKKPIDKSEQMIMNNYATITDIAENANREFSNERICEIHAMITKNTLEDKSDEGVFRNNDNIFVVDSITGAIAHTPPAYSEIIQMVDDLCVFANDESFENYMHPIVKAIVIHFMLAFIHPFVDGNGRTARALFYWYLLKKGYKITEFLSVSRTIYESKKSYERAYLCVEEDGNDMSYFVYYHLSVIRKACDAFKDYMLRQDREVTLRKQLLESVDINDRQRVIVAQIAKQPSVITPKEIALNFGVTTKTARTDLQDLVAKGYLTAVKLNKRAVGYVATEN